MLQVGDIVRSHKNSTDHSFIIMEISIDGKQVHVKHTKSDSVYQAWYPMDLFYFVKVEPFNPSREWNILIYSWIKYNFKPLTYEQAIMVKRIFNDAEFERLYL